MDYETLILTGDDIVRALFFTDVHFTGRNPRCRKDNFLDTVIDKLNQIVELSKEKNCDFVLFGGDLFDTPSISNAVAGRCAKVLRKFHKLIGIAGNHDLFGNNIDNIKSTQLGLFEKAGLIDLLYKGDILIVNKGNLKIQFTGTPSHFGIDDENIEDDYVIDKTLENIDKSIHIVHGMLMEKQLNPHMKVVTIDSIAHTKADLTLCGHYHRGFKPVTVNGKYFANPGSLSRVSADIGEINRKVGIFYIEISKEDIKIEVIPLKQQKGEDVLDRSQIEKNQYREIKIEEFMREISATSSIQSTDIRNIVRNIAQNKELDKGIVEYALTKLSVAEENLFEE